MVLFLNDIGTGEVLLILVFILIFFGSKSIPSIARTAGRTIRQIRDASNDLQSEIRKSSQDLKSDLNLNELIDETARDIRQPLDQYASDVEDVLKRKPLHSTPHKSLVQPVTTPPVEAPTETIAETPISTPEPPKVDPIEPTTPEDPAKVD